MKSFAQKKEELTKLKNKLAKAKIIVFSSFVREGEKGLNVSDMRELKRGLKALDSEYLVGKKTLLDRALASQQPATSSQQPTVDVFQYPGSLGVALGYGDEQLAAKAIYNFAKKHQSLKYFGAIWNPSASSGQAGKFLDLTQFTEFAKLPSKDVMIARLLGMMKYPIAALAVTLKQVADKK